MISTLNSAVKFLEKYIPSPENKFPGSFGLDRMKYLTNLLGNPQVSYKTIHVGGTSGKGSTSTIIASILSTKYKVGLHTSPHLEKINERIQIISKIQISNLKSNPKSKFQKKILIKEITNKEFVELVSGIKPIVEKMEKSKYGMPSYFEIVTAMAFMYFELKKVDIAVIEVGMGGRYDASNVINPEIAVLTNVGLDHTEVLGETVEEIAKDKAGIIKPGLKVVSGVKQKSVVEIVKARSTKHEARINILDEDYRYEIKQITERGSYFDYFGKNKYENLFLSLIGVYQIENAVLAIKTVEEFGGFCEKDIRIGIRNAFISGRMEIVQRKPLVILDGAHNPDKMHALAESVKLIWPDKKVKLVLAIKEGKNAEEMLRIILQIGSEVILTKFESLVDQGKVISYNPENLKEILVRNGYKGEIKIINDVLEAINEAINTTKTADIILVTGSLYLIGKVREKVIKYKNER